MICPDCGEEMTPDGWTVGHDDEGGMSKTHDYRCPNQCKDCGDHMVLLADGSWACESRCPECEEHYDADSGGAQTCGCEL